MVGEKPLIMATSDVHSPRYLMQFLAALSKWSSKCRDHVHVIVMAGDMVEKGRVEALRPVIQALRSRCGLKPIVAVFGNEEYIGFEARFRELYRDVLWLDDGHAILEIGGLRIAFYGTRGSLDRPTRWQRRNMPHLWRVYRERVEKLRSEVEKLRARCDFVVVIMHYAPTYATLKGEPMHAWPEMGSKAMERALIKCKPDLVIHGHAHNSTALDVVLEGGVRVVNVAFPARKDLVLLELRPQNL